MWLNNILIFQCVFSLIGKISKLMFVLVYYIDFLLIYLFHNLFTIGSLSNIAYPVTSNHNSTMTLLSSFYSWTQGFYYFKDFVFLFVVFWNASLVNELSDELTKIVVSGVWNNKGEEGNIAMNLFSDPLSFPLASLRLKKKEVIIQLIGITITSFFSLLNNEYSSEIPT